MTVRSIGSDGADGYADYLDGKTVRAERGDYYLGRDGEPIEAPGRWLAPPEALAAVGIADPSTVGRDELSALMQGTNPTTGEEMRAAAVADTRWGSGRRGGSTGNMPRQARNLP